MDYTLEGLLGMPVDAYLERLLKEPLKLNFEIYSKQREFAKKGDMETCKAYAELYDMTESMNLGGSVRKYWEKGANFAEKYPTPTILGGIGGATLLTVLLGPIGFVAGLFGLIGGYDLLKGGKGAVERGKEKYRQKIQDWEAGYAKKKQTAEQATRQAAQEAEQPVQGTEQRTEAPAMRCTERPVEYVQRENNQNLDEIPGARPVDADWTPMGKWLTQHRPTNFRGMPTNQWLAEHQPTNFRQIDPNEKREYSVFRKPRTALG